MYTRKNIVNQIQTALGASGSTDLAEKIFDTLRADDRVYYDPYAKGLLLRDDVDLLAVAAEVS